MDKIELLEIIDKGEDYYTEFKKKAVHPDDLAAEIVGFANSDGGRLLIGVSDDRVPVGVTDADKEIRRIDNICTNNCEPPLFCKIEKMKINDKLILLIKIPRINCKCRGPS